MHFRRAHPGTLPPEDHGGDLLTVFSGATGVLMDIREEFCPSKDFSEAGPAESAG